MSWSHIAQIANGNSLDANQTSFVLTTTAAAEVGNVLVMLIAKDNATTGGGDTDAEITDVVDSVGNVWRRIANETNAGTVQTTTACCVWYTQVTIELPSGGTVTSTFAGTTTGNDATAGIIQEFSVTTGNYIAFRGSGSGDVAVLATDAADPGAITLGSLTSQEYLWIHGLSAEGESTDAYTWDADYTQFTVAGANTGTASTSQHITGGFRVFTGTTDTVDVASDTADRDYAQVLCVLREVASGAGTVTGTVQLVNAGSMVG